MLAMIRMLGSGIALGAAMLCAPAQADQLAGVPRIGVLPLANPRLEEALRQGLKDVGLIEGQDIAIDWWRFPVTDDKLKSLTADLAGSKPGIIVAVGSQLARAAIQSKAPAVVFVVGDPVMAGFADSLARPGRNATGISMLTTDLDSKRLELLKLLAPKAKRIAFLRNPASAIAGKRYLDDAAQSLGVELIRLKAQNTSELDAALSSIVHKGADGVILSGDVLFLANKAKVAQAVRGAKLPAVFPWAEYHDDGVVASYGPSLTQAVRRTAVYIDKILKGTKAADIPIEQVSKYELIIDLRVARAMGIQVPEDLLLRADEVRR